MVSNPPPPAGNRVDKSRQHGDKKRTPSNSGETINRLLNVSIRYTCSSSSAWQEGGNGGGVFFSALLFPVLEVQTSFAVLPRNHRLVAVKVDLSHSRLSAGQRNRTCICARCWNQGRTLRNQSRSVPASRQSCCCANHRITKMRVTSLSWAASLIKLKISGFHSVERRVSAYKRKRFPVLAGARAARRSSEFSAVAERYRHPVRSGGWRDRR